MWARMAWARFEDRAKRLLVAMRVSDRQLTSHAVSTCHGVLLPT